MKAQAGRTGLLLLLVLLASCADKTNDANGRPAVARTPDAPENRETTSIGAIVDLILADAAKLPRAEFDPAALADKLGKDSKASFEWVRDHTSWVPYRGLLRGSQGVLVDRFGNSLDRAVLLGELLRRNGHTVRLVRAQLSGSDAQKLLERVRVAKSANQGTLERSPRLLEAQALAQSQTQSLLAAVSDSRSIAGSRADDRAIFAMQDHWWVELLDDGRWVAMDPLLPEGKAGESIAAATDHREWKVDAAVPSIAEADWNVVHVEVVAERYESGATTEATVLEATLRPAELLGKPLSIGFIPMPWPDALPESESKQKALRDAALSVREWVPYLRTGDDVVAQHALTTNGDIQTAPLATGRVVSAVGGAEQVSGMDMALGGFGSEQTSLPSTTAVWIDYEIQIPGEPSHRLRRPVFDLLGPANRQLKTATFDGTAELPRLQRAEALLSQTDLLIQPCGYTNEFVDHLILSGFVVEEPRLRKLAQERDPAARKALAGAIIGRVAAWGPLPDLALLRSVLSRDSNEWFIDRPNVLNFRLSRPVIDADRLAFRELIDIASNSVGVLRIAGTSEFDTRVRQGVIDTIAEMVVLGSQFRGTGNTAAVFAMLADEGSRGLLIAAGDEASVKGLPWPPDEMTRVGADVKAGFMAVVPRKAVVIDGQQRVGWWRVHSTSGETIGVMDSGYHAADEKAELESTIASLRNYLARDADDWATLRAGYARAQSGRTPSAGLQHDLLQRDNLEQMLRILEAAAGV